MLHKLPAVVLALVTTAAFGQEIYSWKDPSGRVHYSDLPPPEAQARTLRKAPLAPTAGASEGRQGPDLAGVPEEVVCQQQAQTAF